MAAPIVQPGGASTIAQSTGALVWTPPLPALAFPKSGVQSAVGAMTVTVTEITNGGLGMGLQVAVITGARLGNFTGAIASAAIAAAGLPQVSITTTVTGSLVLTAVGQNSGTTASVAAASNTLFDLFTSGGGYGGAGVRATALTGSPGAFTAGLTGPTNRGAIAAMEVLPGTGIAVDSSTPPIATSNDGLSVTSPPFTPPAQSLLVAMFYGQGLGTSATQTTQASDSAGLVWTKRVELSTAAITGVAAIWTAVIGGMPPEVVMATRMAP